MERLFLQFSFNVLPAAVGGAHEKEPPLSSGGQFAAAPDLRNKLEELLLSVAENLLVFYVPDVSRRLTLPACVRACVCVTVVLSPTVSVHPSGVSGTLCWSPHRCSCSLRFHWGDE